VADSIPARLGRSRKVSASSAAWNQVGDIRRSAPHGCAGRSESAALRGWLDERAETGWISSVLTEIEAFRALARYAPEAAARLPAVLDLIDLIPLDPPIRILAQTPARPGTCVRP
jgi:hypothetical protein